MSIADELLDRDLLYRDEGIDDPYDSFDSHERQNYGTAPATRRRPVEYKCQECEWSGPLSRIVVNKNRRMSCPKCGEMVL